MTKIQMRINILPQTMTVSSCLIPYIFDKYNLDKWGNLSSYGDP